MKKPQEMTLDELVMVKNCIIYPVILDVLERDIGKMKNADFKIPLVYIGSIKNIQKIVTVELTDLNRELRNRGIKIFDQETSQRGITAKYLCRGYKHEVKFLPSMIKACVVVKVCVLLNLDLNSIKSGGIL
ncbi:hypothetical protein EHS13_15440 [Paenibacillus psychroresistens]|uniref:Uncharacterized protein n=1 Tax=Paenibacillus psychroresistens TaxID=1778678 RepID=A0A6B8RIT1_9BACL|nr:hypothetical protein [Paenibacillus psychroresistens]QGQ96170.1 hypothetical protein EHS13_15440 [Paenibacillus psychroresistens]